MPVDGALDTDRNEQELVRYGAFYAMDRRSLRLTLVVRNSKERFPVN